MPELPEVETVRRGLAALLPGKKVTDVWHDWPKSFPNAEADVKEFLIGATVLAVKRRAKVLLVELDTKHSLVIHLKMTGQLVYRSDSGNEHFGAGHPSDSLVGELPDKTTCVVLSLAGLEGTAKLYFNDLRKFGWMRLIPTAEVPNIDFFRKVGPEPLSADFTPGQFRERLLMRKNSTVKVALLDQTVIAGVGNIYADESLWAAKIHPATLVKDLSATKLNRLLRELKAVLELSIAKGGSSDKNYVDAEGRKGSYLQFANVFRREGQPCPRCGSEIIKTRVVGRGTHICPKCQRAS